MSPKAPTPCCLLDRAGRHTTAKLDVPGNVTPIFLPSRVTELNPVEIIWQYLRNQSSRSGLEAHRTADLKSHSPIYAASNTLMAKKARVKQRLRVWRCFFGVSPPALSANRHSKSGSAAERKSVHP